MLRGAAHRVAGWTGHPRSGYARALRSEYAPSDWPGGELLEHVRERGLSEAERQAVRAQITDAETEFRISLARKAGPLAPGAPRVDVRVIGGRAGDQRVVWLSLAEIADRMRAMADEIAAAEARLAEVTAATFPTVEGQRAALLYEAGYLSEPEILVLVVVGELGRGAIAGCGSFLAGSSLTRSLVPAPRCSRVGVRGERVPPRLTRPSRGVGHAVEVAPHRGSDQRGDCGPRCPRRRS